ncbi:MAG: 3-phosphoglycerate dehydrogenase [Deltaproteobacteria bacterium]|nr:3-phosphoglycerate dehydrogenase [Deltaproteobacteria bacterium]
MEKYRIKLVNKICREGLVLLGDLYQISAEEKDPQGIIVRSAQIDTAGYPSLLAVARAGAGVNNITVGKATASGICVFNTPGANANAVAELVFVMAGIGARNIHLGIEFCRGLASLSDEEMTKEVEARKSAFRGFELAGKTLGVLGLGQIGVRVANGGAQRRMRTIGFDPSPTLENIHRLSPQVTLSRTLNDVVASANILSLHMPYNEKTKGFVDRTLLNRMPDGAMLINYARGGIVKDEDVAAALDAGKLGCYITDFPSRILLGHPKVITSPHLGASTEESEEHCATMAVSELKGYLEHGSVSHSVNFPNVESIPGDTVHTRLIMINRDKPGMIGFASQTIGSHGINIASYLNESNGVIGYNIIDLEAGISDETVRLIEAHPDVIRTRGICYR